MADNGIAKFVDLIRDMIKEEIDKTDSTVVCKVVNKVHYGAYEDRYDLNVEPDENNIIKNIQNASGCELSVGDYVYIYKIDNKLNNCFIFKKIGENTSSSYISIMQDKISTLVTKDDFATSITQTADEISLRATYKEMESEISQKASEIYAQVVKKNDKNETTGFGWSITVNNFNVYQTINGVEHSILLANADGLTVTGEITATSGYIGNGENGFTIGATYIRNGVTSLSDDSHNGIYLGTDGIRLGPNFIVDNEGNVTANTLKTILSVVIEYNTNSSMSIPTTGWSTEVPTVITDGYYLFTRTTTTYSTYQELHPTEHEVDVAYSISRKGQDGTSVEIKGTVADYPALLQITGMSAGDGYIVDDASDDPSLEPEQATEGVLYTYSGSAWVYCGQIKGPKGDPGVSATSYWLVLSAPVHTGAQQSTNITITAKYQTGNGTVYTDTNAVITATHSEGTYSGTGSLTLTAAQINTSFATSDIPITATHSGVLYEEESITYSPLNSPVLDLTNDNAAIAYDGNTIKGSSVSSTAQLYLNGLPVTSGYTYSWTEGSHCSYSVSGQTVTVTAITNDYTESYVKCQVKKSGESTVLYEKTFNVTKQLVGATGNGISTSQRYYGISNDGTDPSTVSTWEGPDPSTIPSPAEGQFLWTKIVDTYTNGDIKNSYSVSYKAKDGTSIDIKGSVATYADLDNLTGLTVGDCYIVNSDTHHTPGTTLEGTMYIYKGLDSSQAKIWNYCGQLKGPKGDTGDPGTDATSYWFDIDSLVHMGSAQASTINIVVWKQTGDNPPGVDNGSTTAIVVTINGQSVSHSGGSYTIPLNDIHGTSANIIVQAKHGSTIFLNATIVYSPKNTPILALKRESSAITYKGGEKTGTDVFSQGILYLNGQALTTYYFTWEWDNTKCTAETSQTLVSGDTITVSELADEVNEVTLTCIAHNNATVGGSSEKYYKYFTVVKQIDGVDGDGTIIEFEYAYWYSSNVDNYPSPDKPENPGSTAAAETWYISTTEPTVDASTIVIVYRSYRTKTTIGSGTPTYSSWSAGEFYKSYYTSSQRDTLRIANKLFGYGQGVYYTVTTETIIGQITYKPGDMIEQTIVSSYLKDHIKDATFDINLFKLYVNAEYIKANWIQAGELTANTGKIAGFNIEPGVLSYGTRGSNGSIYLTSDTVVGYCANNPGVTSSLAVSKLTFHGLTSVTLYIRSYSSAPESDYVILSKVGDSTTFIEPPTDYTDTNAYTNGNTYNTSNSSYTDLSYYKRVVYTGLKDNDYIYITYRHYGSGTTNNQGVVLLPNCVVNTGTETTLKSYIEFTGTTSYVPNYYFYRLSAYDLNNSSIELGSKFYVNSSGVLTATDGNFQGTITSTSGNIGGFTIAERQLSSGVSGYQDYIKIGCRKYVAFKSLNQGLQSTYAVAKITFTQAVNSIDIYIRSYAEATWDYTMASIKHAASDPGAAYPTAPSSSATVAHTQGHQSSGKDLSSYTKAEYTDISVGDYIYIVYKKDGSRDVDDDTGWFLFSTDYWPLLTVTNYDSYDLDEVTNAYIISSATAKTSGWLTDTEGSTTPLTPINGHYYKVLTTGSTYTNHIYMWGGSAYIEGTYQFDTDSTCDIGDTGIKVGQNFVVDATGTITSADISGGSISIGNGAFLVDSDGKLTALQASLNGEIEATSFSFVNQGINLVPAVGSSETTTVTFTGSMFPSYDGTSSTNMVFNVKGSQAVPVDTMVSVTMKIDTSEGTQTVGAVMTILAGTTSSTDTQTVNYQVYRVKSKTIFPQTKTYTTATNAAVSLNAEFLPTTTSTTAATGYNLGNSSHVWRNVFANNISNGTDSVSVSSINNAVVGVTKNGTSLVFTRASGSTFSISLA